MAPSYSKDLLLLCILRKKKIKLLQKSYGPNLQMDNQGMGSNIRSRPAPWCSCFVICQVHINIRQRCTCFDLSLICHFVFYWVGFVFLQVPVYSCQQHIWWKDGTITTFCFCTSNITYQAKEHLSCLPVPRVLRQTWDFSQIILAILLLTMHPGWTFMLQTPVSNQPHRQKCWGTNCRELLYVQVIVQTVQHRHLDPEHPWDPLHPSHGSDHVWRRMIMQGDTAGP